MNVSKGKKKTEAKKVGSLWSLYRALCCVSGNLARL